MSEGDRGKLTVPRMIEGMAAMRVSTDPERFIYGDNDATAYVRDRLLEGDQLREYAEEIEKAYIREVGVNRWHQEFGEHAAALGDTDHE